MFVFFEHLTLSGRKLWLEMCCGLPLTQLTLGPVNSVLIRMLNLISRFRLEELQLYYELLCDVGYTEDNQDFAPLQDICQAPDRKETAFVELL